jgi:hypothetical protein
LASFYVVGSISRHRRLPFCEPSSEAVSPIDPELDVAARAMVAAEARFVVVGPFGDRLWAMPVAGLWSS